MKRAALLIALAAGACTSDARDPVTPPTDSVKQCVGCGPTDLKIDRAEVLWSGPQQILYSGDTLRLAVHVRNLGKIPSDTAPYLIAYARRSTEEARSGIGSIAPGATVIDTLRMVLPMIHHDTTSVETIEIDLYRDASTSGNRLKLDKLAFRPTHLRMTGPDTIRAEQAYAFTLRIINPSPRALRPSSIGVCFEAPQCRGPVLLRIEGPNVAPGTTAEIPMTIRVPVSPSLRFPQAGNISGCYGWPGVSYECGWRPVTLLQPLTFTARPLLR